MLLPRGATPTRPSSRPPEPPRCARRRRGEPMSTRPGTVPAAPAHPGSATGSGLLRAGPGPPGDRARPATARSVSRHAGHGHRRRGTLSQHVPDLTGTSAHAPAPGHYGQTQVTSTHGSRVARIIGSARPSGARTTSPSPPRRAMSARHTRGRGARGDGGTLGPVPPGRAVAPPRPPTTPASSPPWSPLRPTRRPEGETPRPSRGKARQAGHRDDLARGSQRCPDHYPGATGPTPAPVAQTSRPRGLFIAGPPSGRPLQCRATLRQTAPVPGQPSGIPHQPPGNGPGQHSEEAGDDAPRPRHDLARWCAARGTQPHGGRQAGHRGAPRRARRRLHRGGWPGRTPDTEFFARAQTDLRLRNATLAAFGATCRAGVGPTATRWCGRCSTSGASVVTLVAKSHLRHVTDALRTTPEENPR